MKFVSTPVGFEVDSSEQQQTGALVLQEILQSTSLPNGSPKPVYHFSAGCTQLHVGVVLTSQL